MKTCFMAFIFNENVFYGIYLQRKRVLWHLPSTKFRKQNQLPLNYIP